MPDEGCLALATLRPILEQAGIVCDELHGTQLYPHTTTDLLFLSNYAAHLFVPQLYEGVEDEQVIAPVIARFIDDLNLQGLVVPEEPTLADLGRDEGAMRVSLHEEIARAGECIDRCVEGACDRSYDIVGFSVTFETQLIAALAIARRLKARNPKGKVVFGGAACAREPGEAIAVCFPWVDVVCYGEGERVIVPLVRTLRANGSLEAVPGIVWRRSDGHVERTPSPPPVVDLDQLPQPDYDNFVTALADSEWRAYQPKLFFEASRGCWWGQRKQCAFCGLNPDGLPFRKKSPARAFEDIRALYGRYTNARRLQGTDNILDTSSFGPVLTKLSKMEREEHRPLRIFLEIKPGITKKRLSALVAAGVDLVQAGIESFSDELLGVMNKGCSGLGQIQFLKWAAEAELLVTYNLIVRCPGERAQWYREMTELIPAIEHLRPPTNVTPMWLERFSPFHTSPERSAITGIRSKPHYGTLFRDLPIDVDELAYVFDYDHESHSDPELVEAQRSFVRRVGQWQQDWTINQACFWDTGDSIRIVDHRNTEREVETFGGRQRELFLFLDRIRTSEAIARRFPGEDVDQWLSDLIAKRWVVADARGRYLAVLPQRDAG